MNTADLSEQPTFMAARLRTDTSGSVTRQPEWVLPDYRGGSILNLVESLTRRLGARPQPDAPPLRDEGVLGGLPAGKVVLLVIDGLGDHYLRCRGQGSLMLSERRGSLTSVFPSTTASAVTTLSTGLAPATHGLNGWVTRDHLGALILPLPMVDATDERPLASPFHRRRLFPYRTLFQRIERMSVVVSPAWLINSTYSRRHNRGAKRLPYDSLETLDDSIFSALAGSGRDVFVHAYYPGFDSLAHDVGIGSEALAEEFWRIDAMFGRLANRLAGSGTLTIVTADHGLIDAPLEEICLLGAHRELADMLAQPLWGERRAAWCALRQGAGSEFSDALKDAFDTRVDALPAEQLTGMGLLGPGPAHRDLATRVGDMLLLPRAAGTLVNEVGIDGVSPMRAVHGGLSPVEMEVPLIALRC
ncbi:MAG: alkaline phosphatase family protein [Rhodocyclaceae bacterium]|nr:alkaline phosphatase family protein [Rhodocyclaceae bacterium]